MPIQLSPKVNNARTANVDDSARPHAVFDEVPAALQDDVDKKVAQQVAAWLPPDAPANVKKLVGLIGDPSFYDVVATIDPKSASDWREMGKVQRSFHAAEPKFDAKTRAYSESMRLTLHAALIQHLVDGTKIGDTTTLFDTFLELHPTAFFENGAWFDNMQIGWEGALEVVKATRIEMAYHLESLVEGGFENDVDTQRAAQWVRVARRSVLNASTQPTANANAASSGPPRPRP